MKNRISRRQMALMGVAVPRTTAALFAMTAASLADDVVLKVYTAPGRAVAGLQGSRREGHSPSAHRAHQAVVWQFSDREDISLGISVYFFVNTITTVSAMVFPNSADTKLMSKTP